jgi:toxin FitB
VAFLLDTNVISEARKPAPNPNVRAWLDSVPEAELYLSVLVVGEIRQGIERLRRRDPAQAEPYELWLSALQRSFADRLVPITADVCQEWGRLNVPDPLPVVDGLMAATASRRDLTLVTRNVRDLARTGVRLLNPFGADPG